MEEVLGKNTFPRKEYLSISWDFVKIARGQTLLESLHDSNFNLIFVFTSIYTTFKIVESTNIVTYTCLAHTRDLPRGAG